MDKTILSHIQAGPNITIIMSDDLFSIRCFVVNNINYLKKNQLPVNDYLTPESTVRLMPKTNLGPDHKSIHGSFDSLGAIVS